MAEAFTSIPVISLHRWRESDAEQALLATELVHACHEVGFFLLTDHGIDQALSDRYFTALQSFFDLPVATKQLIDKSHSRHFSGWEAVGAELTNNRVDYREQIDLSTPAPALPADTLPAYLRLYGPNQWLPEAVLPGFCDTVTEYFAAVTRLADEVMEILAVGLGLPAGTFAERFGNQPRSLMKLICYPPTPPGEAGVNGHHDTGFLTLLRQHGVSGLQVENPLGEWVAVPPRDDAFVVNLGEMLQAMTGNYLLATKHRVICSERRFATAYFHSPDLRVSLAPLTLASTYAAAVAASSRHRDAGFMATRSALLDGAEVTSGVTAPVFGEQAWNYYVRSYPQLVRLHYPDLAPELAH